MRKTILLTILLSMIQSTQAVTELSMNEVLTKIKNYESNVASGSYILLDSIIVNNSSSKCIEKYIRSFVGNNASIEITESYFKIDTETNSTLEPSKLSKFSCDLQNKIVIELSCNWNSSLKVWENDLKKEYTLDSKYNIILENSSSWAASSGIWSPTNKTEFAYNANGDEILEAYYVWDSTLEKWIGDEDEGKLERIYDDAGALKSVVNSEWNEESDVWEYSSKNDFENIGADKLFIYLYWNSSTNSWIESSRKIEEVSYVGTKNIKLERSWDKVSNTWINISKTETTIDTVENGMTNTVRVRYVWSITSNNWVYSSQSEIGLDKNNNTLTEAFSSSSSKYRREYAYDSNNNKTLEIYYSDSLNITTKNTWMYDDQGNQTQHDYYGISYKYINNVFTSVLDLQYSEYYFYSHITTTSVSNDVVKNYLTIYPNPVTCEFQINGIADETRIQLFNLNGQVVLSTRKNGNNPILVQNLPQGLYILKISSVNGSTFLKMKKK